MGDSSPLSVQCTKALTDKMNDKRKAGALEVEKTARSLVETKNYEHLANLIRVLAEDFAKASNSNVKKGGLMGLAAVAIGIGQEEIGRFAEDLINPNLICISDSDSKVRFFACESLYNIVRIAHKEVPLYLSKIFVAMIPVVTDVDQNVRAGADILGRALKDVIMETSELDVEGLILYLKDKMYTKDSFARLFFLDWLLTLEKKSDTAVIAHLSDLIDPLFDILSDSEPDIYTLCENIMGEFLDKMKSNPQCIDYSDVYDVLIVHFQSSNLRLQLMAVHWIQVFVNLSKGKETIPRLSSILKTILCNLSVEDESPDRKKSSSDYKFRDMCDKVNIDLMHLTHELGKNASEEHGGLTNVEIAEILDVLTNLIKKEKVETRLASLRWIYHLFEVFPNNMEEHIDKVFSLLPITLCDPSDNVVILTLEIFAKICSLAQNAKVARFKPFISNLLNLFREDKRLLEVKGSFIVRQLCMMLNAEDVYRCISELLVTEKDLNFARLMVENLSTILLTTSELYDLRSRLKDLNSKEACEIFCCLYRTWCHSPVATIALCLQSGCYKHVGTLIEVISTADITIEILIELDKLVQLIESPLFTYMRMQLLDTDKNADLVYAFYGILMLLPQSRAFSTLKERLSCIPPMPIVQRPRKKDELLIQQSSKKYTDEIDFESLALHYITIQSQHAKHNRESNRKELTSKSTVAHKINSSS